MIEKTGGKFTSNLKEDTFEIIITAENEYENNIKLNSIETITRRKSLISHKWILDSISNATILDYDKYLVI